MEQEIIDINKNYKVKVIYANKIIKSMILNGQQISNRRRINFKNQNTSYGSYALIRDIKEE